MWQIGYASGFQPVPGRVDSCYPLSVSKSANSYCLNTAKPSISGGFVFDYFLPRVIILEMDIEDNSEALKTIIKRTEIVGTNIAITNAKITGVFISLMNIYGEQVRPVLLEINQEMINNCEDINSVFEDITRNQAEFVEIMRKNE